MPAEIAAYVALGSNLDDPPAQVERALGWLAELGPLRRSSLWRTEPLGDPDQPWYCNAVAELRTALEPAALLAELQALERRAGRPAERARWAPRLLDLDLILYGARRLSGPGLTVPHPRYRERRFVLAPLAELAPDLPDPADGCTIRQLLARLDDPLRVEKMARP